MRDRKEIEKDLEKLLEKETSQRLEFELIREPVDLFAEWLLDIREILMEIKNETKKEKSVKKNR